MSHMIQVNEKGGSGGFFAQTCTVPRVDEYQQFGTVHDGLGIA